MCRVLCYTPRHDLDLGRLPLDGVRQVVDAWADQTSELGGRYRWVQVFENRGTAMGASSPHPHGQIWAGAAIPSAAAREDAAQRRHHELTRRRLLTDYAEQESGGPRVVDEDPEWLAMVPFWAAWPYETLLIRVVHSPVSPISTMWRATVWQPSSSGCSVSTTPCSGCPFPIRWAGTVPV
jgi:UDPglucose--hexose-1-phosphate uridylyltransferase